MSIAEDVRDIIAAKGSVDPAKITPAAKLTDLEISSLDVVEIVFALEDRFDIQIPFNANTTGANFSTVGAVTSAVEKLVAEKS
jgi:acyl carrier protein